MRYSFFFILVLFVLFESCNTDDPPEKTPATMQLVSMRLGPVDILNKAINDAPINQPVVLTFSVPLKQNSVDQSLFLETIEGDPIQWVISYLDDNKTISARPDASLSRNQGYKVIITDGIRGEGGEIFPGFEQEFTTENPPLEVISAEIDNVPVNHNDKIEGVGNSPEIRVRFSEPVTPEIVQDYTYITGSGFSTNPTASLISDSVILYTLNGLTLEGYSKYRFTITSNLDYSDKEFDGFGFDFYTKVDSTLKFPEISDDQLLTKIQEQTFRYFWDFGHPTSGLSRERNTSGETVTSGGSGFGVMSIIVGIERGFISRQEGVDRLEKITTFLDTKAERFHGAWSHWLNGTTGKAIPFSNDDDGADLVETAFMIQGLLTVRQYLDSTNTQEAAVIGTINKLWDEVEWDWFTQNGQNVLFWHWSPNFNWQKNHRIEGWNEALIIYVLGASSTTYAIDPQVYHQGWTRNGGMVNSNNNTFYGHTLPLRNDMGGPLFFAHYSFLGLDPRNLSDQYASYWEQNVNHSKINHDYCLDNPKNFIGYSNESWGLTASDNHEGYSAHSPNNDLGVITPTAAISSIPYTPIESMDAIRHFYYILGDKLWGNYGFYDAFNITEGWYASSYLAIDQGPIIIMIENHRTGLLWDLFMSAPEVQNGLTRLDFTYD